MEIGQQPMMQSQENKILNKSSTLIISVSLQELNIYLLSSTDNELKKSLNTQFSGNNSTDILLDNLKESLLDFDIKNVLDVKLICATSCSAPESELSVANASTSILPVWILVTWIDFTKAVLSVGQV